MSQLRNRKKYKQSLGQHILSDSFKYHRNFDTNKNEISFDKKYLLTRNILKKIEDIGRNALCYDVILLFPYSFVVAAIVM